MVPRRTVLVALAAATASFAKTQTGGAGGDDAGPDEQYIRRALTAGALSLAASRIAQEKAHSDDVREFAQLEVTEQETLADVLKSLLNPDLVDGTIKPLSEAEVEQHLDPSGRAALEKMRSAPAGAEFDREYVQGQANGHMELLQIHETYLNSGRVNPDFTNVAKIARGMTKEHLQLLDDLQSEIEFGGATTGSAPGRDN